MSFFDPLYVPLVLTPPPIVWPSGATLRIKRMLERDGVWAVRQIRAVGSRDATTGRAALTYNETEAIRGIVSRATSRANPQESGSVTDTVRTFHTQGVVLRGDQIALDDGVYVVETKPDEEWAKGQLLVRKVVLRRLEFT